MAAKNNFVSLTNAVASDLGVYRSTIGSLRTQILQVLADSPITGPSDINTARNSLNSADGTLASVQSYASGVLASALTDYLAARDGLIRAGGDFDATIDAGSDTSAAAAAFLNAQLTVNLD